MAKAKERFVRHEKTGLEIMDYADGAWFDRKNLARESGFKGNEKDLTTKRTYMARTGWWKNTDGMVTVSDITPDEVKEVMKDRQEMWDGLKAQARLDPSKDRDLRIWEQIFLKDGKIREPRFWCVTGHCRASIFFSAMVARSMMFDEQADGTKIPLELEFTVPVQYRQFTSEQEILDCQNGENEGRLMGNLKASALDQLLIAKRFMGYGMSQGKLREKFSSPTLGVKYYYIVLLDAKFPTVGIINRCKLQPADEGYIHVPSIQHAVLQGFGQRFTLESTTKYNSEQGNKNQRNNWPVLAVDEVTEYFANPKVTTTTPKMMNKNEVLSMTTNKDKSVARAADAIHSNNTADLQRYEPLTEPHNDLDTLFNEGDLPTAAKILHVLATTKKGELRNQIEKALLAAIGMK